MSQPSTKKQTAKSTRLQIIGLGVLLLTLMITSAVTGLMAVGVLDVSTGESIPVNSMSDAMFVCDRELKAEYKDKLQTHTLDDLSSRSDAKSGGFKLFYELTMFRGADKNSGVSTFFVNCFVSAKGRVRRLDVYEQKEFVPKAVRRSHGNAFGL